MTYRQRLPALGIAQFRAAAMTDKTLAQKWLIEHAEHRLAVLFEGNQRAPQRLACNEGARAVERIEHPAKAARSRGFAELLTQDRVLRKGLPDHRGERGFGAAIGLRYRIVEPRLALVGNGDALAEIGKDHRARRIGETVGQNQTLIEIAAHAATSTSFYSASAFARLRK